MAPRQVSGEDLVNFIEKWEQEYEDLRRSDDSSADLAIGNKIPQFRIIICPKWRHANLINYFLFACLFLSSSLNLICNSFSATDAYSSIFLRSGSVNFAALSYAFNFSS